ncbi:MAG TPA: hypothetical protein VN898_02695, partial [Candidatus Binatia bacterium]|nr:hypothetical protein [Candidatus Binatia bacterium]
MRLERLSGMGLQELASRGRQEAAKWLDRLPAIRSLTASRRSGDGLEETLAWAFQRFNEEAPGRFFAGVASDGIEHRLDRCLPPARLPLLEAAEAIGRKRFDLLGYRELSFGDPIDWRLDPVSGRRAPFAHWSRIDLLDSETMGDPKVIWELNRHQWLVTLGQAYRLD